MLATHVTLKGESPTGTLIVPNGTTPLADGVMFEVLPGRTARFERLTIQNSTGPAVLVDGSSITSQYARYLSNAAGGVVLQNDAALSSVYDIYSHNQNGYGGAVSIVNGSATFNNVECRANNATVAGGCLHIVNGTVRADDATIA